MSECEPCTLFPLLQSIHRASPEHPPTPTQTHKREARMDARVHTCTHVHSKVSEMPSEPPDETTPPCKQRLLMQGEALLFSGTMSVLTFLCLHIFKQQKRPKELGGGRSQRGMQSQPLTCSDLYKLPIHISISNNFPFNNHAHEFR